jgi:hypothetical protein
MSTGVAAIERATGRRRVLELLEREGLLVAVVAVYAAAVSIRMPTFVNQDSWFALLGGREVLHHGFPGTDTLTYWTLGKDWIDQQWLGQAILYAVYSAGGLKLLVLVNAAVVLAALTLALYCARRLGAGPRSAAVLTIGVAYVLMAVSSQVRAQTLVYPLFVLVLYLLVTDSRAPSNRILVAIPLLALWANMHGSVALAAVLVVLRAIQLLLGRASSRALRRRGIVLLLGSALAMFATPYGLGVTGYYQDTIFNPSFKLIVEWLPPTFSPATLPLYVLMGLGIWLLGRHPGQFTRFERLALILLAIAGLTAIRNVVWFALAALPLLAPALDTDIRRIRPASARTNVFIGVAASVLALVVIGKFAVRPLDAPAAGFPDGAVTAVARAAAKQPSMKIYANERYADWLFFTHPELRGRIAYDVRFELLTKTQAKSIYHWRNQMTESWQAAARGARLIVLDPRTERRNEKHLLTQAGAQRLYRDRDVSVVLRPTGSTANG